MSHAYESVNVCMYVQVIMRGGEVASSSSSSVAFERKASVSVEVRIWEEGAGSVTPRSRAGVYLAYLEQEGEGCCGAFVPDFLGCIGLGRTPQQARDDLCSALKVHIEAMLADGDKIPDPTVEPAEGEDVSKFVVFFVEVTVCLK